MLETGIVYRVSDLVIEAGALILAELRRPSGPRGSGYKAEVDAEIDSISVDDTDAGGLIAV